MYVLQNKHQPNLSNFAFINFKKNRFITDLILN